MADQYLAIPIVACAVAWNSWASWAYTATALALLLNSPSNILGPPEVPADLTPSVGHGVMQYRHAQVWLILLLMRGLRRRNASATAPTASET
jgi:hypothetical protein